MQHTIQTADRSSKQPHPYGIVVDAKDPKVTIRIATREDWVAWLSGRGTASPQSSCGSKHPNGNPLIAAMTDPCDMMREVLLREYPTEDPETKVPVPAYPEGALAPGYYRFSVDVENPEARIDRRVKRPSRGWKRERFNHGEIVKVEHRKDLRSDVEVTEVRVMLGDSNSCGPYCDNLEVGCFGPNALDGTVVWMPSRGTLATLVRGALAPDVMGPRTVIEVLEMYETHAETALGALEKYMGERPLVAVMIEALELMKRREAEADNAAEVFVAGHFGSTQ